MIFLSQLIVSQVLKFKVVFVTLFGIGTTKEIVK